MEYEYTKAWKLYGGLKLQNTTQQITITSCAEYRAILTHNPDQLLRNVDENYAIGALMLSGPSCDRTSIQFINMVSETATTIRNSTNRQTCQTTPILIFQAHGKINPPQNAHILECPSFQITLDIDTSEIKERHKEQIESIKAAIGLVSPSPMRFAELASGIHFITDNSKPLYSILFSMRGDICTTINLTDELCTNIHRNHLAISEDTSLSTVKRLISEHTTHNADSARAFIQGWGAAEILINKTFKTCSPHLNEFLAKPKPCHHRDRVSADIEGRELSKLNLYMKASIATAALFHDLPQDSSQELLDSFKKIKIIRDKFLHGENIPAHDLPYLELSMLARRLLQAYILLNKQQPLPA